MAALANDLLGNRCPFGAESSAKHMSSEVNCPDLRDASNADRQISHALRSFQAFASQSSTQWQRRSLDSFEDIGARARLIHESAPARFSEIYPLDESRNAEALVDRLSEADSLTARSLLGAHRHSRLRVRSHRLAARSVMAAIGHQWADITAEEGIGELQLVSQLDRLASQRHPNNGWRAPNAFGSDRGIAIGSASLQSLITYQTIQERIDSAEAVQSINVALAERMLVLEDLLGIQAAIVEDLQAWIAEDFSRLQVARAFSEIALVEADGTVIPNSRFLKILVHNWGDYIAAHRGGTIEEIVAFCGAQARLNLIYEQNILVLRREGPVRRLYGIAVRACPAAAVIAPLVSHYASLGR